MRSRIATKAIESDRVCRIDTFGLAGFNRLLACAVRASSWPALDTSDEFISRKTHPVATS